VDARAHPPRDLSGHPADGIEVVVQLVQLTSTSTHDGRRALPADHREAIIPT
jgi:hypothetical protein